VSRPCVVVRFGTTPHSVSPWVIAVQLLALLGRVGEWITDTVLECWSIHITEVIEPSSTTPLTDLCR
jgi:hypothetical protein